MGIELWQVAEFFLLLSQLLPIYLNLDVALGVVRSLPAKGAIAHRSDEGSYFVELTLWSIELIINDTRLIISDT